MRFQTKSATFVLINGTTSAFQDGSALQTIYDSVNQNIGNLINEYLNPTLNSTTNKAKMRSFQNALNSQMYQALENNIINPLAQRNMIRSSQATDMYNKASSNATGAIADYANNLLETSQSDTASIINNLLNAYMKGYNVIRDTQSASIDTSKSNATENIYTQTDKSESLSELLRGFGSLLNGLNVSSLYSTNKKYNSKL